MLETLDRLRAFHSEDAPVLSLYLNLGLDVRKSVPARLKELLRPAKVLAEAERLGRDAAMSLRADVGAILEQEGRIAGDVGHGVAVFACHQQGLFEYINLARPAWDTAMVGPRPYLRPLRAVLDETHPSGTVVVDPRRCEIFESTSGDLRPVAEVEAEEVRKANFGGWHGYDEHGARHHATEVANRHYRETAVALFHLFRERGVELLFVGGRQETIDDFVPLLHPYLRARLAGTFVVDVHTASPAVVREHSARLAEEWERRHEQALVGEIVDAANANGRAVAGVEKVLQAGNQGAISLLLINGTTTEPGKVCGSCRWLAIEGDTCSICGAPMWRTEDVLGELAELVAATSGTVEHVMAATPLAEHTVAARVRFPVAALSS